LTINYFFVFTIPYSLSFFFAQIMTKEQTFYTIKLFCIAKRVIIEEKYLSL